MIKRVLVTGKNGQLGQSLQKIAGDYPQFDFSFVGRDQLDLAHSETITDFFADKKFDAIINCAAHTAVDKAETETDLADQINHLAVKQLAHIAKQMDAMLIHISTDYVFDGTKSGAYLEDDEVSPLGVYGSSKLAGEQSVREICEKYYILRTSWVFSAYGNNFVKTMLRLGAEREELSVVADQYGKPTSAIEIANVICKILASNKQAWGTYHLAQPEATTWYDFAEVIFAEARNQGMDLSLSKLHAIQTEDYPTPAKRPKNSVLDCFKLESTFKLKIKSWEESLKEEQLGGLL
jgi:dTDP-4-dehydrorhamnose reductase